MIVSDDNSVGEKRHLTVLFVTRVQFPPMAEYLEGFFPADHILPGPPEPAWQKMAQSPLNGTT